MMLYRSLVVGLLGAIAMLVASRPALPTVAAAPEASAPSAAIVDVSRAASGTDVTALLGLSAGERVVAINDVRCAPMCSDVVSERWRSTYEGEYVDFTVAARTGERRVLVLVH